MGKVFLSYARENTDEATRVRDALSALGFTVWFDQQDLLANQDISTAIDNQIAKVEAVLVLWSAASRESVWVRGEALSGLSANKYIGSQLDPVVPPVPFNARNAPNLAGWTGAHDHSGWDLLVRSLASMMGNEEPALIKALERLQLEERAVVATIVASQAPLPFADEDTEALTDEHAYQDVDALLAEAENILKGEGGHDLSVAITQAALNQEMLRDANFVVDGRPNATKPRTTLGELSSTIQAALEKAKDGDLIVVCPGRYEENLRITKSVRIFGLGLGNDRPVVIAKSSRSCTVDFVASARLENLAIETTHRQPAVYCTDNQPVLVRCVVSRFSKSTSREDGAIYVARKANPIVIATSVASSDAAGVYFVTGCGGTFLGGSVTAYRAAAIVCRGQPKFRACEIEAIGGHAVEVLARGLPSFDDCDISGKGAPVVRVVDQARPQIRDSRVSAIRQYAFDFEGDGAGAYERNIVHVENDADAGTAKPKQRGFFGWKAREDAIVQAAVNQRVILMRSKGRPLFVSNTMSDGNELSMPGLF